MDDRLKGNLPHWGLLLLFKMCCFLVFPQTYDEFWIGDHLFGFINPYAMFTDSRVKYLGKESVSSIKVMPPGVEP